MTDPREVEVFEMMSAVIRSLVDRPEDVEMEAITMPEATTFRVRAHPSDMGKLIGMNGRTARALRVILGANAARLKRSFSLDLGPKEEPSPS